MQTVSANLELMIDGGVNNTPADRVWDWAELCEIYSSTYVIPSDGFHPADAVYRFSSISQSALEVEVTDGLFIPAYSWNGQTYVRQVASRGDITRSVSQSPNNVTITLSNTLRYSAQLYLQDLIQEGMWLVIRLVSRSVTDSSIVLFTGKVERAIDIDEDTVRIPCREPLSSADIEIPKRTFTADDPEGRLPGDPLYQGFRFVAQTGAYDIPRTETTTSSSFFGLIRKTKKRNYFEHRQYSSIDKTPYGEVLPEVYGQAQIEGIPFNFFDNGIGLNGLWAFANGRISTYVNIRNITKGFGQPENTSEHHGFITGEVGGSNNAADMLFPNAGTFSKTAYLGLGVTGSSPDVEDDAPTIVSVILGRVVPLPDEDDIFQLVNWSDNNAYITRDFLTNADFLSLPMSLIDDVWTLRTAAHCDEAITDTSNGERIFIPANQTGQVGSGFNRYWSTSHLFPWWYLRRIDPYDNIALAVFLDQFDTFDEEDPTTFIAPVTVLRRRYTCNVTITEKIKAIDFLYKTLLPSFRGFITQGANGKYQIKSEQAADSTDLTANTSIGATEIPVEDITKWKASMQGRVLIGTPLLTSEHREVTNWKYSTAGNAITLTASATMAMTAIASGATLSGANDTTPATATVTIGGTAAANAQVIATINGIVVAYTLDVNATVEASAGLLSAGINADPRLSRFVEAVWNPLTPTVVTIKSKLGNLVLDAALVNAHTGPRANPTVAPTLAAAAGLLTAGTYLVSYSYVTVLGETLASPTQSIVLTADQLINVTTVTKPVGVTSIKWYVSTVPDSTILAEILENDGTGFSINSLPLSTAQFAPGRNSTGEETIRVMMAFDASNIIQKSFKWPLGNRSDGTNQWIMQFRNASMDFSPDKYVLDSEAHQLLIGKIVPKELDGSAIDNWDQAVRLTQSYAAKELDGAPRVGKVTHFFSWASRGRALLLEEGDVVPVTDDTGGGSDAAVQIYNVATRIEDVRISEKLEVSLTARAYRTSMYIDRAEARSVILPANIQPRVPTDRLVLTLTGGTYTLTPDEAAHAIIEVQGVLASNQIIYVPTGGQWTVINNTTGAFSLTVEEAP